jgi:hypothetical protein
MVPRLPEPNPGLRLPHAPAARRRATLAAALATLAAAGCGGGGGSDGGATATSATAASAANPAAAAAAAAPVDDTRARRLAAAEQLYAGTPRVPEGFRLDPAPAGASGAVATLHLKNADLPGAAGGEARWELCASDPAVALGWSELRASWQGSYADLVETNASEAMFEFVRVPRGDTSARLRHRVFRCSWLDRSGSDLDAVAGVAGVFKAVPVSETALRGLVEYLWQFTAFNNADHVVLASVATPAAGGQVAWRIEMVRLLRAAMAGECDRIERLAWTHAADAAGGALTRRLDLLESFRARRENGVVQLCGG